jgi:hypothetical protein
MSPAQISSSLVSLYLDLFEDGFNYTVNFIELVTGLNGLIQVNF